MNPLLSAASNLYALGLHLDRFLKTRIKTRLPRPVISVGNLTVGGTGKTPLLLKLAHDIANENLKPAILTRGYGEDEVQLMREKLPQVLLGVGANRGVAAHALLKKNKVDVFLLDDGFQHWRLDRQLDVVCVDTTNPWGGGHLLPAGQLRESVDGLKRADVIVLTRIDLACGASKENLEQEIRKINQTAPLIKTFFKPRLTDTSGKEVTIRDQPVLALSAIGNPLAFEEMVRNQGAQVRSARYRDHHVYSEHDLADIEETLEHQPVPIVTTEKDAVKLKQTRWGENPPGPLYVLQIELDFVAPDDKKAWDDAVIHGAWVNA